MNANISSSALVYLVYCHLKQDTYYDKMDFFLRSNVVAYEASDSFQKRQAIIDLVQKISERFLRESQNSLSGTISNQEEQEKNFYGKNRRFQD